MGLRAAQQYPPPPAATSERLSERERDREINAAAAAAARDTTASRPDQSEWARPRRPRSARAVLIGRGVADVPAAGWAQLVMPPIN